MIICRLVLILNAFGWPVHAAHSLFSESLIRKDPLQNVLDHEPVKHQPACQNSVVGTLQIPCVHPIKVSIRSSQVQSRRPYATMKLWRASTMNSLAIYPTLFICLSSDTFRQVIISSIHAYLLNIQIFR